MSGDQPPAVIDPEMVFGEKNFVRRIQNALGVEKGDIAADDTMQAAILYNIARQVDLMSQLAGGALVIENISPDISIGGGEFDVETETLRDAIRDAPSEKVVELFGLDMAADERILSSPITPQSSRSSYQMAIAVRNPAALWADVNMEENADFEFIISEPGLNRDGIMHYQFQVEEEEKYNFYLDRQSQIHYFRVQEVYTGSGGPFTDGIAPLV